MCGGMPSTPSAPKPPPLLPEAPQPPPMTRTTGVGPMVSAVARKTGGKTSFIREASGAFSNFGSESSSTILGG